MDNKHRYKPCQCLIFNNNLEFMSFLFYIIPLPVNSFRLGQMKTTNPFCTNAVW